MDLNDHQLKILEEQNAQSKRLRFMLAKLYGANVDVDLRGYLMQASETEFACWQHIENLFYATKGKDSQLKLLADKARIEYQVEVAFEQGRKLAFSLPPEDVAEHGLQWRNTKNPYHSDDIWPQAVQEAWTAGFKSAFDVIVGESW